jgi:hypothetical protein
LVLDHVTVHGKNAEPYNVAARGKRLESDGKPLRIFGADFAGSQINSLAIGVADRNRGKPRL